MGASGVTQPRLCTQNTQLLVTTQPQRGGFRPCLHHTRKQALALTIQRTSLFSSPEPCPALRGVVVGTP